MCDFQMDTAQKEAYCYIKLTLFGHAENSITTISFERKKQEFCRFCFDIQIQFGDIFQILFPLIS